MLKKNCNGKIVKNLSDSLDILRDEYKKSNSAWLSDNFYMLEREGRRALRELKKVKKEPKRLFSQICDGIDLSKESVTYEQLDKIAADGHFDSNEFSMLEWVLRAVIVIFASKMARNGIELKNAVISLAKLDEFDFEELCEKHNAVEKIFLSDPSGIYPKMDRASRSAYRAMAATIADFKGTSEISVANEILNTSKSAANEREKHIGYYLLENNFVMKKRKIKATIHLILMYLIPTIAAILFCLFFSNWYLLLPIRVVLIEGFRPIISLFAPKTSPLPLPKLDFCGRVPLEHQAAVIVSEILPCADKMHRLSQKLERLYLTNADGAVIFGISADFKAAKTPSKPEDRSALREAKKAIDKLNKKYGGGFFLTVRKRTYNKSVGKYIGYERKRGAITALVNFIKENDDRFALLAGDKNQIRQTKYIIALDSDTILHTGGAYDLVSAAAHPFNRPEQVNGKITKGFGIITPSIGVDLVSSGKTPFSRLMSGVRGTCPYGGLRSDFLNDSFGTGIFSGKGIIDVEAYYQIVGNAFPENLILSHDIPEGALMRTGFASDIEITDCVPSTASAWLLRQHRWIRGDWQNLRLVFDKRFSSLDRYRLTDNLRRSLTEPFALIVIIASLFMNDIASAISLLCVFSGICVPWLTSAVISAVRGGSDLLSRRYYSNVMSDALSGGMRAGMSLIILPAWGLMAADAILRALWRQFVSHKKMLEWTTASEGDKITLLRYPITCFVFGILMSIFSPVFIGKVFGIAFIGGVFAFTALSKQTHSSEKSDSKTNEQIISWAAAQWKYYEKYCNKDNNYLPPDNVQESPVARIAHRTSPTNIGMYLLSVLAAYDFRFIDSVELCTRLEQTLSTVEKLPKWYGNLYNWYDTEKLTLLKPIYVSAVDSGNFAVCMTALAQGLKKEGLDKLYKRVKKITDDIDLSPMYNKKKNLFHIGYDAESGKLSNSYYDLLMSEARAMSYYAAARRQVSRKHWGALGRTLVSANGHIGAVSWTGTMFEYYMPQLFLPALEGSLEYESLKFAFTCQHKRAELWRVPWGISESGFFAFDNELNYLYKAHGVQKIGLKRGLDDDIVISPYSSFLLLKFEPEKAVENLKRLENTGMTGECGFYEAADHTPSRRGSREFSVVRSYMAHHIGMSIIACANAVFDNIMVERFMSDEAMNASQWMLEERIPVGAVVFDDLTVREVPNRPHRKIRKIERAEVKNLIHPEVRLYSNGSITLAAADSGVSVSMIGERDIFVRTSDILTKPCGFFAAIKTGSTVFSITPAPLYNKNAKYNTEVAPDYIAYYGEADNIEGMMKASVHPFLPCEERNIIIKNNSKVQKKVSIATYTEPILAQFSSYSAHIAFSKLFLQAEFDEASNTMIYERRERDGKRSSYLAIELSRKMKVSAAREEMLERPYGIRSLERIFDKPFNKNSGVPDCCFASTEEFVLQPGEEYKLEVRITAGDSREDVLSTLAKAAELKSKCGVYSPFSGGIEEIIAPHLLSCILFGRTGNDTALRKTKPTNINELWRAGISGDYPIILAELEKNEGSERIEALINIHKAINSTGIKSDLVFVIGDAGDYERSQLSGVRRKMSEVGYELMLDVNGGIHIVDSSVYGEEYIDLLRALACCVTTRDMEFEENGDFEPFEIKHCDPVKIKKENGIVIEKKPDLPWCLILANATFGTLVSDSSLGFTWASNARENKLTPWTNDTRTDNDGELLLLRVNGNVYNMLNGSTPVFTPESAKFYGKAEGIEFIVTITVPKKGCIKYCDVEFLSPPGKGCELAYYTEPLLFADRFRRHMLVPTVHDNALFISNTLSNEFSGCIMLKASDECRFVCSRTDFLSGNWKDNTNTGNHICGTCVVNIDSNVRSIRFSLAWAASEKAAIKLSQLSLEPLHLNTPTLNSGDEKFDEFFSQWLPYQILNVRIFARTGFYQCGGAWGYRDQLQDACAAIYFRPDITRQQILRCAAHQFPQGDVLHWWHRFSKGTKGVRTRCSDDYLWLVFAVCEYIRVTDDRSILDCKVQYLDAEILGSDEHEKYITPARTKEKESIRRHCERALEYSMKFGSHGLLLIGSGDWNDGMNKVGAQGKGESVWLSMFAAIVSKSFSPYSENGEKYIKYAEDLLKSIDENAWDGEWYRRAYFDDGRPLGSAENTECMIDSLPQSFSIFANMHDEERKRTAMKSAEKYLVDKQDGIIKLFYPPFYNDKSAGYISGYAPGVRENGSQYTHAAIWLAMAALKSGYADGISMMKMLYPFDHDNSTYKAEPYVMAADIYSNSDMTGRAGWTQYTGSAGWYYKALIEFKKQIEEGWNKG